MKYISHLLRPGLWLIPLLVVWFSMFLGNRPFASPDEGRYVEIPREMATTQDYITPRLNGVKYFEKPPLFYWLQAAHIKIFGIQEWAMRLISVLFAIIGCLAVFLFSRRFYNDKTAFLACIILATSPLYYALSRLIILDMAVTSLITLSLLSFILTVYTPPGMSRRLWAWAFYTCSALGVLTKGLMVLAISGPTILIWTLITNKWREWWPAYIPTGCIIFFLIAAPWHIVASIHNPEFAYKYFIIEHFMRYTTSVHLRTQHFLFFVPVLCLGFFPWIGLVWSAMRQELSLPSSIPQRDISLFLLIWAAWVFSFFSVSNSKLIPYILPCFPPLAIIVGSYWSEIIQAATSKKIYRLIIKFSLLNVILSVSGLVLLWQLPHLIDHKPYLWLDFTVLACLILLLALIALVFLYIKQIKIATVALPLSAVVLVAFVIRLMPELQHPSVKPLAQTINTLKRSDDIIGSYKVYYQDLPVYLNQIVHVFGVKGEMEFGCEVEDCSKWMLNESDFLNLWKSKKRLLIVTRQSEILNIAKKNPLFQFTTLGISNGNVLITNSS
ncbi:MAG: glycosyltransferase family 39 protein [Alphaproteobacteria bacterium]|nr:glycosyltransferase family 39 protein [Alphaproteobacteria bacterium]